MCYCFTNQTGVDCSLSRVEPPTLTSLKGGEFCDTYLSNCQSLVVYGNNFVNFVNLTCHFTEITVSTTCACLCWRKFISALLQQLCLKWNPKGRMSVIFWDVIQHVAKKQSSSSFPIHDDHQLSDIACTWLVCWMVLVGQILSFCCFSFFGGWDWYLRMLKKQKRLKNSSQFTEITVSTACACLGWRNHFQY